MPEVDFGSSARRWLTPGPASPWRFDDAGDALVWRDGDTVAFRAEVEAALRRVASGLQIVPPFPAVAILFAAARAEGRSISPEHWDLVRDAMETATPWLFARVTATKEVAETASALRMLEHVPAEVFARPDAMAFLVEAVFEAAGFRRDPNGAAEFLRHLDAEPTPGSAARSDDDARRDAVEWGQSLAALRQGLGRLDPATLARRARTGLDHDVAPAEEVWPDGDKVRGLLASLRGDADLGAVAELAADAMAAVGLPRPGALPEELPIGGYADLANRGSPERLLVSELAHDGLTLAVRVALHEALYLRREAPPRAPHGTRCILVDSGIRLWGVGRIFATSVALALGATSEKGVAVRAWRADGNRVERVDLGSRAGVESHLEALRPEPHPAAALRPFLATCDALEGQVECCVVLHANALAESAVRDALRTAGRVVYVAALTAAGDLEVHAFSANGSQVLRTAKLDLDALLAARPSAVSARTAASPRDTSGDDPTLPAILRLDRLPLRVPSPKHLSAFREAPGHGVVARTHDRRIVLWEVPELGPVELSDHTPPGALRDFRVIGGAAHLILTGGHGIPTSWMRIDLGTRNVETRTLPSVGKTPSTAVVFGDSDETIGLVTGRKFHVIDTSDISRVWHTVSLPTGAIHSDGTFFKRASTGEWWMLNRFGERELFQRVRVASGWERRIVTVFTRSGLPGVWVLFRDPYQLTDLTWEGETIDIPAMDASDYEFRHVGSSGHRLVFQSKSNYRLALVDLTVDPPRFTPVVGASQEHIEPMVDLLVDPNVRRHARAVEVSPEGALAIDGVALTVRKGQLQFEHSEGSNRRPFWRRDGGGRLAGRRWELREARFDDGSRVYADSRGMVHLVSSDRSVPEVTLVFRDGETAGWASDGVMCGPRYYLGDSPSVAPEEFMRRVRRFTERLR